MSKAEILDITNSAVLSATIPRAAVIQSLMIAESQCLVYAATISIFVPQMKRSFRPEKAA